MAGSHPTIGILALQGDVREHRAVVEYLGGTVVELRQPRDLNGIQGVIIPGGESSVIDKLARRFGLAQALSWAIDEGLPAFGTCAGMIYLATDLVDGIAGQQTLRAMDITVQRNAFGSQRESFDTAVTIDGLEGGPMDVSFIRAPVVTRVGPGVSVRGRLDDGRIVAVDDGRNLALAFHPEVTGDSRLHREFVERARDFPPLPGDLPTTLA